MDRDLVRERAIELATKWQTYAQEIADDFEKSFQEKMQKMLANPVDKVFLIELMDQCFRSKNVARVENQIEYLFSKYGMASFFTDSERFLLFLFRHAGTYLPQISIPLFVDNIRNDTKKVVLAAEEKALKKHLDARRRENTRVNLNLIGEVVLGENEAQERMDKYLAAIENPNIDYISVKISTLFSQINSLDFDDTVEEISKRLSKLYRHAILHKFKNRDGEMESKFINLDMEEYRDLAITVEAFTKTLSLPEFKSYKAGIVLQAYLPDSHLWQKKLVGWARARLGEEGAPIKVRLVKGANMEMEETEASLRGWSVAPYRSKIDTDSNYKLMLQYGLNKENAKAVHLGAASHNLFELAYAFELAKENQSEAYFSIEMLEGMSEAARFAINEVSKKDVILYAPIAGKEQFTNAIAYLVRRLDENTSEDNFIRYSFGLKVGSADWEMLKEQFISAFDNMNDLYIGPRRKQDRTKEDWSEFKGGTFYTHKFQSEPDTDFVLPQNKDWVEAIIESWKPSIDSNQRQAEPVIGGEHLQDARVVKRQLDKSQAKQEISCGSYFVAEEKDLKRALEVAEFDPDHWRTKPVEERMEVLSKASNLIRQRRGDLIGVAAAEVGKTFTETDVEVSEAVDFVEFYSHSARFFHRFPNVEASPKGVALVVPPWNFPIAIPLGGVVASLAAGNTVLLKPASNAVLCSYEFCKALWDAGVSKNTLQFVPCPGSLAGEVLVKSPIVSYVILTGGEDTAMSMLSSRNDLLLTAETGGKDATIVTSMSDREQAIHNVVKSAFMNSGQKCSATSLLVLENEVYFDEKFKEALVDAANSLSVGSVWNLKHVVGTLANSLSGDLKKAVENLDEEEFWALPPSFADDNPYLLRPSIKYGVKEGSYSHNTEFFGPVLSVMRADDLKHAVEIVNSTGYGLTSGLESLDEREQKYWKENIKAGNLYINRGTTGAVVLRQPFGGMGKSAVGAGIKVGGYNYLSQFIDFKDTNGPEYSKKRVCYFSSVLQSWISSERYKEYQKDFKKLDFALQSYLKNFEQVFSKTHDYFKLRGEDNIIRYLPLDRIAIRIEEGDNIFTIFSRIFAAKVSGIGLDVSVSPDLTEAYSKFLFTFARKILKDSDGVFKEDTDSFCAKIQNYRKIFYSNFKSVDEKVWSVASKVPVFVYTEPPLMEGRIELIQFFQEQSISHSYHRYGNLGARGLDTI
ncbi:MAG: proline dehydrogenase family protein [Bdellovibrionales bacterium]